jgi:hypothetical protein
MNSRKSGFCVLMILGVFFLLMLLFGQMMSFINYDFSVSLGLQESVDILGDTGVAINKAFGVGDTMIYLPLLLIGLIGLWLKKKWGLFSMIGALGITAYWPMVCLFILIMTKGLPEFHFNSFIEYTVVLSLFTIYGIWGIGYLYKNYKELIND